MLALDNVDAVLRGTTSPSLAISYGYPQNSLSHDDSSTAAPVRQEIIGQRKRISCGKTIGPGAGPYAILVQAPAACAARSLLERAPVEP